MIAVLGALFLVGTALSFFISSMSCKKVDMALGPQQGALWAALPALVYGFTGNRYAMMVATWIPTVVMVYAVDYSVCKRDIKTTA